MKTTSISCDECGTLFERRTAEINRSTKLGRRQYCSTTCQGKNAYCDNLYKFRGKYSDQIVEYAANRRDEFTGLREFMRRISKRQKKHNITLEYLKKIWDECEGICAYSSIKLSLPTYNKKNDPIHTASLDRKDSNKPYEMGNVQFVSTAINWMKNAMTHEQTLSLISLIKAAS